MLVAVAWIVLALIWGTTWLAIRVGLDTIPPATYASLRFLLAGLLLATFIFIAKRPLPRETKVWKMIAVTGLQVFGLGYALQFWGQQFVPSGLAAVVFASLPLFTLIVAHYRLDNTDRLSPQRVLGAIVGLFGVTLIFWDQVRLAEFQAAWAVGIFLVASVIYAWAQVTVKKHGAGVDPNVIASMQMSIGGLVLLGFATVVEGPAWTVEWNAQAVTSLLYLAILGSAVAFFMFYWLMHRMRVTSLMTVMLVNPIIAITVGRFFLGEELKVLEIVGSVVTLMGLALVLDLVAVLRSRSTVVGTG